MFSFQPQYNGTNIWHFQVESAKSVFFIKESWPNPSFGGARAAQEKPGIAGLIDYATRMVPRLRLELRTLRLKVECSTTELAEELAGMAGIEPARHGVKVHCLTAWLHPKAFLERVVGEDGFEPPNPKELIYSQPRLATSLFTQYHYTLVATLRAQTWLVDAVGFEPTTPAL